MNNINKKKEIVKYSKLFSIESFSPIRSGNISIRSKLNDKEGFFISPSGKINLELTIKDIVFVSLNGDIEKHKKPSSEWRFHLDLYNSTECNAIVHAHSKFAVICSCLYKKIPSFHYMIALTGKKNIKVANYALFGSKKLSINILNAIKGSKSCLISNHGQISIGNNLPDAYELANEVELLCEYYYYCRLQKHPKILNNKEMQSVLNKIKSYKSKNGALR
jgi:L-fuculose-phosphate aldolase